MLDARGSALHSCSVFSRVYTRPKPVGGRVILWKVVCYLEVMGPIYSLRPYTRARNLSAAGSYCGKWYVTLR